MNEDERKVMTAVLNTQPMAYGANILDEINKDVRPNWLTRQFPALAIFQGKSIGWLIPILYRLESRGLLSSEWGEGPYPRHRHYTVTDIGAAALEIRQA